MRTWKKAAASAMVIALTAVGGDMMAGATNDAPITVGIITTTSGPLGIYGEAYLEGLHAGLDYATEGTGAVNGRPIQLEIVDDGGDPQNAITAATNLVGQGTTVIAGTAVSSVALPMAAFAEENGILYISGAAAVDAITGINRHTFRAGRQTWQDIATAAALVESPAGAEVLVLGQDSAFGQGNVAAVEIVLGSQGASVDSILVPMSVTEFTPFAEQVLNSGADLLVIAWAGETAGALFGSLEQQGVFQQMTVTTGLGDVASYSGYSSNPSDIKFLSHFVPGTLDNPAHNAMAERIPEVDIFTPDGFVTAQMIVRALTEAGPDDVDGMIEALEGWTFEAPKGTQTIRASDHAMLQPMFTATLVGEPGAFHGELIDTIAPELVAPPELP